MALTKVSGSILKDPLNLGEVSIGGTLTYEDVTNVDSVGIVTARSGIHIDDSITHIGDTNTKIRFPAADTITAETGGSERLRISSTGNVSIGNNATPDTLLHLHGDKPKLRIESTNTLEASAGTEEIARIEFEATKSSNRNVAASMRVRQDGTWSTVDDWFSPTAIEFYTQDQSGTEITTPRLTINKDGVVNIGDTTASALGDRLLQIGKTDRSATYLELRTSTSGVGGIVLSDGTASDNTGYRGTIEYAHSSDYMLFKTAATERLRIDSSGTVKFNQTVNLITTNSNSASIALCGGSGSSISQGSKLTLHGASHGSTGFVDLSSAPSSHLQFRTGTVERLRIESDGELLSTCNNNGQIIHTFYNQNDTSGSSAMTVEHHFNFNRTSGAMSLSGARIIAGKEREWVGAAANQDGYFAVHTTADETSAEKMRISSGGIMTRPYQPAFSAQGLTSPVDSSEGYTGQLSNYMQVIECNIGGHYKASGTDVGKFVAPVAGNYFFSAMILFRLRSGSNANGEVSFYKNNTNISVRSLGYTYLVGTNDHDSIHITSIISLAAGDKVHFGAHNCSAGGDWYWGSGLGNFHGYLIG